MDQAPSNPTCSSKPSLLKPPLSTHPGNNHKGKQAVYVWVEKVSSASSSFSSRPPPPPELPPSSPKLPQPPTVSASSSNSKRRNRRRRRNKKASLESSWPLVPVPPPSSPSGSPSSSSSSSGSPPSSPKLPPSSRPTFTSAHSHLGKTWIEKGLSNPSPSSLEPPPSFPSGYSSSSIGSPPSSPKLPPTLRRAYSSHARDQRGKSFYSWIQKGSLPIYKVPNNIKALIKKDIVPKVLHQPLSPLTYKNYFAALLYAEEVYLEKWKNYQMVDVTLNFEEAPIMKGKPKNKDENKFSLKKYKKKFVTFEIDSVPERRPFLISRDFVYARPSGRDVQPFEGILYRVVKSSRVLVDFGHEFHYQHLQQRRYDISFSFNRLCFKRAHAAVSAVSSYPPLFRNYLFPDRVSKKSIICRGNDEQAQMAAVSQILRFHGPPRAPYIIEGQRCVIRTRKNESNPYKLSETGEVVREAALEIYKRCPDDRILICAPLNSTCDELMISLKGVIPEGDMYRTNAAFREVGEVPLEILLSCDHDGECFSCPSLGELKRFRLIFSTFVSSFRLHNEGITAGHFSHIFLVDAALATEPETMIALANFANESTAVIVTGAPAPNHQPNMVRSDMARTRGLKISYFERLSKRTIKPDDTSN